MNFEEAKNNPEITVEKYLNSHCISMINELNSYAQELINKLREDFHNNKIQILNDIKNNNKSGKNIEKNQNNKIDNKNNINEEEYNEDEEDDEKEIFITIQVQNGPHKGKTIEIQTNNDMTHYIGRSTGSKFRKNGVSLYKDDEVSTTHGKIMTINNKVWYMDLGSTNGTFILDEDIEENVPYELTDGMIINMGKSELCINITM